MSSADNLECVSHRSSCSFETQSSSIKEYRNLLVFYYKSKSLDLSDSKIHLAIESLLFRISPHPKQEPTVQSLTY